MPSASGAKSDRSRAQTGPLNAGSALRIRLVWLTVFRTVATTLMLAITAARLLSGPVKPLTTEDVLSFGLIGLVYGMTLVYGLLLARGHQGRWMAWAQVLGDVVLATSLVYLTGGAESPFSFTYSLAVVAGAILLDQRGAIVAAAFSTAAFLTLLLLAQGQLIHPAMGPGTLPLGKLVFLAAGHLLAQLLIGVLSSYLSRELRVTGRQLSRREDDLRRLVKLQRQILACIPSGLLTCTAEGRVTYVNGAGATILGLSGAEAWPEDIEELIPGVMELAPEAKRAELRSRAGEDERVLGLTVTPIEADESALLVVFQDLTELRRAEDALRRADRLAALGTLAAQLAHEIRNPLAAMRGSAQILARDPRQDQASGRLAEILLRESDRLAGLVDQFLKFARPPAPALQHTPVDKLVRDLMELLLADPELGQTEVELDLAPVATLLDPDQLRQVLLNLLRNAFSAAGDGKVRVSLREEGGRVKLSVWDSAGSIPPANLKRIFDPFFTTRPGGTGLGLSAAQSIVTAHGGLIVVSSSPMKGTEFVIGLPSTNEARVADPGR